MSSNILDSMIDKVHDIILKKKKQRRKVSKKVNKSLANSNCIFDKKTSTYTIIFLS